ncbi:hypothetical protein [Helicobacter sp. UBA3407]|uniref:hypothetical protein n=1 Tax=Helicobacter sp. UBA3407 TaxID=1946588 RepID=UPI002627FF53|nr:hypothetical protein [Helicobacter sp. UBA3407]
MRFSNFAVLIDNLEYALNAAAFNNAQKSLNTAKFENLKAFVLLYKAFGGDLNLVSMTEHLINKE